MKIVTDSSVMYSIEEGSKHGIEILPLSVSLGDETWLEYEDISTEAFLKRVRAGEMPTSSSPPPALILEAYDTDEEIVHIAMADGLSGTYEVACGLKNQARHPERVHIMNSKTLCIPHRMLALHAVELAKQGLGASDVIEKLTEIIPSIHSYLIPEDFDFLRRGGRLTPLAAKIVSLLKVVPVMEQTEDGRHLERFTIARQFNKAIDSIANDLEKRGIDKRFFIGVSHADNHKEAQVALERLAERFPHCNNGIFELGPAFITQGGPECIAIQVIPL